MDTKQAKILKDMIEEIEAKTGKTPKIYSLDDREKEVCIHLIIDIPRKGALNE